MPPKLRSKTTLESQDSISNAAKAAHERFVPAMVEQFEKNTTYFLQEEFASDNSLWQEAGVCNINNDDIHVPNVVEFQAMIENLQRLNVLVGQCFDEKNGCSSRF